MAVVHCIGIVRKILDRMEKIVNHLEEVVNICRVVLEH